MNYQEAIRIAEEREAKLKDAFFRFDFDDSKTIDMEEVRASWLPWIRSTGSSPILPLLDDLGVVKKLRTEPIEFATKQFVHFDHNDDGVLSFEEFKGFYNAAIDDMNGKKPRVKKIPRPPVTAEDGPRAKITEERMRKKAEESERIRKENAEMKARIAATSTGRDSKELDAEILALRKQKALERTEAKAAEEARLKEQNREKKARIKAAKSKTDHDLLDDMVDLDGDGVADCSAAELRKRQAAAGKQAREDVDKDHKKRASELKTMKQNTQAKVDADIDDDMVDTDGDGIADMTQGELRRQKAAEGEQKLQDRADAHKQNAAQLENMKTNAQSRTDHGADGEEAEPEGDNADSPADDNAGDAAGTADAEEGAAEGAE